MQRVQRGQCHARAPSRGVVAGITFAITGEDSPAFEERCFHVEVIEVIAVFALEIARGFTATPPKVPCACSWQRVAVRKTSGRNVFIKRPSYITASKNSHAPRGVG